MIYQVAFTESAIKTLKKMDRSISKLIIAWIRKNLEGCNNPRIHGKGLTANQSDKWRYKVGDYRIPAQIQDDNVLILILTVGHRSKVYK